MFSQVPHGQTCFFFVTQSKLCLPLRSETKNVTKTVSKTEQTRKDITKIRSPRNFAINSTELSNLADSIDLPLVTWYCQLVNCHGNQLKTFCLHCAYQGVILTVTGHNSVQTANWRTIKTELECNQRHVRWSIRNIHELIIKTTIQIKRKQCRMRDPR